MFNHRTPNGKSRRTALDYLIQSLVLLCLLIPNFVAADGLDDEFDDGVPAMYRGTYQHLSERLSSLDSGVLALGLQAFASAEARKQAKRKRLTIIDYSLPSTRKRLWVIDLDRDRLLFHELVAHGKNSGVTEATQFSNIVGSRQSSLGTFLTARTYRGKHGYSLRLDGLEKGINHKARERAIVIHGADYASEDFVARHGRLGRSWGCPAVNRAVAPALIDAIKDGSVIFAYYPDPALEAKSPYLKAARYSISGS